MAEHTLPSSLLTEPIAFPAVRPATLPPGEWETPGVASHDLRSMWNILRRRLVTVLALAATVLLATFLFALSQPRLFEASALIDIEPENQNLLNFKGLLLDVDPNHDEYLETQYKILGSVSLARAVMQAAPWPSREQGPLPSDTVALLRFQDKLHISPLFKSNLVRVSFLSRRRETAIRVVNALVTAYIARNVQVKLQATAAASQWIAGQLASLKTNLQRSEDRLQSYSRANGILFVGDQERENLATARLQQLQEDYTRSQEERIHAQALSSLARRADAVLPDSGDTRTLQALTLQLAELERQYFDVTTIYKPDHPRAQRLARQLAGMREALHREHQRLLAETIHRFQAARERETLLRDAVAAQTTAVNTLGQRAIQYGILKREAESNRSLYDGLLERLREAEVNAGLRASNIRIVDPATVPDRPARPILWLDAVLGLLAAILIGGAGALLQEHLDNSFRSPEEITRHLGLPVLGLIPASSEPSPAGRAGPVVRDTADNGPTTEAYRALRTALLLQPGGPARVLLVSSSLPGEGKTTTTVHLAVALAALGRRVVVVDSDLRRPRCHALLGTGVGPGLADYLEHTAELEDILHPTLTTHLQLVPYGQARVNSADLLMAARTIDLIEHLRARFDFVLLDSPPILQFADARVLSPLADAVLLVVREGAVGRESVVRARRLITQVNGVLLGVVLNGVNFNSPTYAAAYGHTSQYYQQVPPTPPPPGVRRHEPFS